jgi:hypothetical protein
MSNLGRRIERLEEKFSVGREPRVVIVTINPDNLPEDAYTVELFPGGPWAFAIRGGPFADEEIRQLREEHKGPAMPREGAPTERLQR